MISSESPNTSIVITDASCFILLDKIGRLSILQSLFSNVITTPEIAFEFVKRLPFWVEVIAVKDRELLYDYADIVDIGEASAIALAAEIPSPTLVLDDIRGRKLADKLSLAYTGTIGLLILAKERGIIHSLSDCFDQIKLTNFRFPEAIMRALLEKYEP
ncbi:putative nucleic acid-binding protein [Pedobacter sp. UYP24]